MGKSAPRAEAEWWICEEAEQCRGDGTAAMIHLSVWRYMHIKNNLSDSGETLLLWPSTKSADSQTPVASKPLLVTRSPTACIFTSSDLLNRPPLLLLGAERRQCTTFRGEGPKGNEKPYSIVTHR